MKKLFVVILILVFTSLTAFADQAAYVSEQQAKNAVELLRDNVEIKYFCAPCEDQTVELVDIDSIEAAPAGYQNYWEVKINGEGIDLAYAYYWDTKKKKWKNVAKTLKIKVSDVPKYLPEAENKRQVFKSN